MSLFQVKDLPYANNSIPGISEKEFEIHHDKLYAGYVNKRNEIEEALKTADKSKAHHNYSEFRALKLEETFNADGQILHEIYFQTMGPGAEDSRPTGELLTKIEECFGSVETYLEDLKAVAMAARGWAVSAYDPTDAKIHNFLADFHSHGGVWGATPILTVDVYEHAFFMDFGADKKAYLQTWSKVINWSEVEKLYSKILK